MRRHFLFVAVVLVACSWSKPARAQFGGFGQTADPVAEIEAARAKAKAERSKYAKSAGGAGAARRSQLGGNFTDTYGRADLAGHAVPGYPAIRGDLGNARVSRGGANGKARPSRRRAR